ncbi:MAG: hypothetical protein IT310_14720 [Anaerolineales bacterium]|nr:hypothetical protein [Anaerolineales bacterium]
MKKFFARLFNAPWHPLALSAYAVLALLASNAGQVAPSAGLRALLASLTFGALVFLIVWLFFRQSHKAAFLTSLLLALFFTYGHAYIALAEEFPDAHYAIWLNLGWAALGLVFICWASRPQLTFVSATPTLNTVALALMLMAVTQMDFGLGRGSVHRLGAQNAPVEEGLTRPENPPDVYFFLMDSYARSDLLKSAYGFDNRAFDEALTERGFYVATCSQSNYVRTELSLGSSLNMQYLQDLDPAFSPESTKRKVLWDALKHNAVRYNFETLGYQTINFATGFDWLEIRDVNQFMSPPAITSGMSEFEGLFLRTTLARYAQDWGWVDPDYILGVGFRDRFTYIFNSVDEITQNPQPTFAYIHLISPHPPFVFDAEGNPTYPPDYWNKQRQYPADLYQKGYLNQVQNLNRNMLNAVDTILKNSATPPIIIIQSDHGPWLQTKEKRMRNYTALYFPGHADILYPTVTPVNVFRLVFDAYFGGKYDILKDVSYFSPVPKIYDFDEIKNPCVTGN